MLLFQPDHPCCLFDIDQSTYGMMFNYQLFLENAKRNFIMGSYPKVLNDALKGQEAKKRFRDLILNYKIPRLWDNRNVWNVGGPFKEEFTNLFLEQRAIWFFTIYLLCVP